MEGSRILIAIRDFELRKKISKILTAGKYHVQETENGSAAVEIIRNQRIDLIICAVDLVDMDGFGVLRLANKFVETAATGFVMLLEKYQAPLSRKAMELGTDGYLVEPFDDLELLNLVEVRLRKKRFQGELLLKKGFQINKSNSLTDALPWFKSLLGKFPVRTFERQQVIFYKDEHVNGFHFVMSGRVKTFISDNKGNVVVTAIYKQNDYFGLENLFLGSQTRDITMAIEHTEIVTIPLMSFQEIMLEFPDLFRVFFQDFASRVSEREDRLLETVYSSVKKRVSRAILKLADPIEGQSETILTVSRNDIANFTGVAPETLSRVLGDFSRSGLIGKRGNDIIIERPDKLRIIRN